MQIRLLCHNSRESVLCSSAQLHESPSFVFWVQNNNRHSYSTFHSKVQSTPIKCNHCNSWGKEILAIGSARNTHMKSTTGNLTNRKGRQDIGSEGHTQEIYLNEKLCRFQFTSEQRGAQSAVSGFEHMTLGSMGISNLMLRQLSHPLESDSCGFTD